MSPVQCRAHDGMEMDILAGSSSSTPPVGWWWRWMLQRLDGEHLRAAVEQRSEHRLASGSQGRRADGLSSSSRHHDQDVNHPSRWRAQHRLDGVITEQTAPAGCVMGL